MHPEIDNTISDSGENSPTKVETSPDLVNKVADRVWQMWKRDLRIEHERFKPSRHRFMRQGGY